MIQLQYKHIRVVQTIFRNRYQVISTHGEKPVLAVIEWNAGWRCWELAPNGGTGWTTDCLVAVCHAMAKLKYERAAE